jgi:hypothetical protein
VLDLLSSESDSLADDTDYEFWHAAMGYPFNANVNRKHYENEYLILDCLYNLTFNLSTLSKSKNKDPNPVESKSTDAFELIHTDVCRPFPNESHGGSKYLLTVIDKFSPFSWVSIGKRKLDTSSTLYAFFNYLESQFSKKIKQIRSDNAGEYISNELKDFFLMIRVIHELTPPYLPQSNGITDHVDQILNMIARSITIGATNFPFLWATALPWVPI